MSDNRLDRIEGAVEANSEAIGQLATAIGRLVELAENREREAIEFRRTTQAALDRVDRVMDYLMRRDGLH